MEEGAQVPREMTEEEILDCIHDFGVAARNAIEAGFDGVEIHGANGYLVDQFLQDTCNKRADAWGGNVEKRAKFALEVTKNVVEAAGPNKVGIRLSPFSTFQGMRMQDPVPQFTHLIERLRDMKLAYLHVVESRVNNIQDVEKTEGIEFALEAWGKDKPVLVAGGFKPDSAKKAVDEEYKEWDVGVVFGRYFVSTPDLVYRLEKGLEPNPYDRSTFYTPMTKKGYLDYPFSEEFWRSRTNE
ncbi:NADH:flavin oxidoreductase/NADH oxidase [Macrophomina phaseolina MS6]|uniref:NADH:flavin oxidoreductase/NADH oxidase n=1 Tax=Macrophomina phaseolina (strain MS6) TaxID=1126212 RepID=K2R5P9_MACPH|nr:NADH:flavin oxidoreductase/NADH oxidase [Macrophomina phaseolina MS6]